MRTRPAIQKATMGLGVTILLCLSGADAWGQGGHPSCAGLPSVTELQEQMNAAASPDAGGLFGGTLMWGAVVNRNGELCALVTTTEDPTAVWPGSRQIAIHKAHTANGFSLDGLALSTAMLYTFSQPGHSLFGLNTSNAFDSPDCLAAPGSPQGLGKVCGGIITFGGGHPLYSAEGSIIGGLGISGDTACTDHEMSKRVRDQLSLNPPGGALVDDISYSVEPAGATAFTHPLCLNTFKNGVFLGTELPASGY